ncbi:MAG: GtrA family protein [Oscillospiraceae bacterium]|nr:GtrA family protein [Oscillospiraceae bacterium]
MKTKQRQMIKTDIKYYLQKYREVIVYLIVGVLTTIFSWFACWVAKLFLDETITLQNNIINTIGWVAGVLFAYPLNRKWVFKSTNPKVFAEFLGFAASRVSTWLFELLIMTVTVNYLQINYWVAKIFIAAVIVVILNYVFSKILIFKKPKNNQE